MNPTDCLGLTHLPIDFETGLPKPYLTLFVDVIDYAKSNFIPIAGIGLAMARMVI